MNNFFGFLVKYQDSFLKLFLVLSVLIGVLWRYQAIWWNKPYLHDNLLYGNAAQSLAERGDFKISTFHMTGIPHEYSVLEKNGEYLDHNPFWPILGAGVMFVTKLTDPFIILSFLSFVFGLGVIGLLYLVGNKLGNKETGILAAFCGIFSYILIDFSGNGSFYIFQAFLYLLFIYFAWGNSSFKKSLGLGLIAGISLLVVQQSISLVFAYIAYSVFFEKTPVKERIISISLFLSTIALIFIPWVVRNYYVLGDFFPPADTYYIWDKLGVIKDVKGDVTQYQISTQTYLQLIHREITSWIPNNAYYINRQLFILLPFVYIAAVLLVVEFLFNRWLKKIPEEIYTKLSILFLVLAFHVAISAAWPITKFRYFVSMVPLVIIAGIYYINCFLQLINLVWLKKYLQAIVVTSAVLFCVLTWLGSPSHTFYYGGILTTDPFGQNGEEDYIKNYTPIQARDPKL